MPASPTRSSTYDEFLSDTDNNSGTLLKDYKNKLLSSFKYHCYYPFVFLLIISMTESFICLVGGTGYLVCLYTVNQSNFNGSIAYSSIDFNGPNYFAGIHAIILTVSGVAFSMWIILV